MKRIVEALLIATDEPLPLEKIAEILKISAEDIKKYVDELNQEYQASNRSFEIKEIAGGFQIYTLPEFADWVSIMHERKSSLSKAALETLAIVAYHQPITRGEIEKLRGVDSSWILYSLLQKGLVKTCGRLHAPGRPIKYGTTKEFLRYFGINDIADLPKEEDFGEKISDSFKESENVEITSQSSSSSENSTEDLNVDMTEEKIGEEKEDKIDESDQDELFE